MKDAVFRLIRKLQEKIRIDMTYLARGSFWSTTTFITNSLLSIALVWAFANLLPKEIYGTYKFIMSIAGSLSFLTLTGINTAVTQAAARGQQGVLKYAIELQLRWNLIMGVALFGVAGYYFFHNNLIIAVSMIILAAVTPLIATYNTYGAYLTGTRQFRQIALNAAGTSLFYTIVMTTTLVITDNLIFLVAAYGIANLIPMMISTALTLKRSAQQEVPTAEEKNELVHYVKHLSIINIFSTLSQYVDKIVVFHYVGAIELAVYGIALAMPERIRGYFKGLSGLLIPKIAEKTLTEIRKIFYVRLFQSFLIGCFVSLAYFIVAPLLFKLLLPTYPESILYSQIIGVIFIFIIPANYIGGIFRAHKMIRALYWGSATTHITRIILFVLFGMVWGVWGVVLASLGVHFLGFFLVLILWEIESRKHEHETASVLFDDNKQPLSE